MNGKLLVSNRLGPPRVLVAALEGTLVAPLTSELLQVLSLVRRNVLDEVPGAEIRAQLLCLHFSCFNYPYAHTDMW